MSNDTSFILKRNKKTGNYSIMRKGTNNKVQRAKYTINGIYLPYGCEEYNDNLIINGIIDDSTNINHNLIVILNKIIDAFSLLKHTDSGKYKYSINDKTFFSFIKKIDDNNDDTKREINKYQIRTYVKYGAKVTHSKFVGELAYDQLKGKKCNMDIELGSMWVNNKTMHYGINIFVTHIKVL